MNTVLSALLLLPYTVAAGQLGPVLLYTPVRTVQDQKLSLVRWGGGTIAETDEASYEGNRSIRVFSKNFFQGGIIQFAEPKNLEERFEDKGSLLRLTFLPGYAGMTLGAGASRAPAQPDPNVVAPSELRLIFTTTDGKRSEIFLPINTSTAVDRGWRSAAFPLSAINGFDKTNKTIQSIAIAADVATTIYVGDLRIINDTTPITGEVNARDLNLALGDEVTLIGRGTGGATVLVYQWDFDASDGLQVEVEGPVIRRKFRKPGTFTVTLTIADKYGLKEPFRTTFRAKVNP